MVLMLVSESGKVSNTTVHLETGCEESPRDPSSSKSMTYNYRGKTLSEVLTLDIIENFQGDAESMAMFLNVISYRVL